MQKYKTLADIIALAEFAHRNQTDQAGLPYIDHPRRVMQAVQAQNAPPYVQMAAILHDTTEDTAFTCDMLLALGVPEPAVEIIKLVDRDYSRKIFDALPQSEKDLYDNDPDVFYYTKIRENVWALMLKLSDIGDNTLEYRLSYLSEKRQEHLRGKYDKAKKILLG